MPYRRYGYRSSRGTSYRRTFRPRGSYVRKRYPVRYFGTKRRRGKYSSAKRLLRGGFARNPAITADRVFLKFKYSTTLIVDTVTMNYNKIFNGNGFFNINAADSSGEALGTTEWAALYGKYKIHAAKLFVTYVSDTGTGTLLTVAPSIAGGFDDINSIVEQPYSQRRLVGCQTGQNRSSIGSYMTTKRMFGRRMKLDEDFSAVFPTANPANDWFFNIGVSAPVLISLSGMITIKIVFYAELYDRKFLTQ